MTRENILAPFKRIRVKASLFVLLLLVSTTLVFYLITARIMNRHILNEVIKRAEGLSRSMASTAGYSLLSQDLLGLDNIVYKIKNSNKDIESIAIVNPAGEILVHSDIKQISQKFHPAEGPAFQKNEDGTVIKEVSGKAGGSFEISSPVIFMDKDLGLVVLGINKSALVAAQQEAQRNILSVFAAILVLGVASSLLLSSLLTRPIQELSAGVTELKQGKRSRPLRIYSRDELGRLTESFNDMTALITAQRDKLSKYAQDLEEAYIATVKVLAAAIDARDNYTLGHSTRVAQLSLELGRAAGLGKEELEELEISCLFHDVGKIKIPDSILLKEGKLDTQEKREMTRHTEYGTEILSKAASLFKYIPAVRHHHEWYDGTGYPDGLSGDKIPLAAAIISLADVYDAMTSDRPYRKALTKEDARSKIMDLAGKQFHPELTASFIELLEKRTAEMPQWPRT
jgi:HD-GYP domain-containing protein (c-di-GMP phosphodiesterase class II)